MQALLEFPKMNASIDDTKIKYHRNVNIGLAVSIEEGLIVPSLSHCEEKNFLGICRSVNDIASRARGEKLTQMSYQVLHLVSQILVYLA